LSTAPQPRAALVPPSSRGPNHQGAIIGELTSRFKAGGRSSNMIEHLYANFLNDPLEYALSEQHWVNLWNQLEHHGRTDKGWRHPWFQPLPTSLGAGNPIFTAVSPVLRRGIRVIQHQPTESSLEIQAWLDFFGGSSRDPNSIEELVISCALSDLASRVARSLIEPWASGDALSLDSFSEFVLREPDHARR
jgi:hypothetical protein